ncbi:MAG: hypothetical protein P9L96_04405 [Candidatus Gygaella obscura]|nr:hypothetical protein [Candidatus Gygaella obscura]
MIKRSLVLTFFIVIAIIFLSYIKNKKCSLYKICPAKSIVTQNQIKKLPFIKNEKIDFDVYLFSFKIGSSVIEFIGSTEDYSQLHYCIESISDTVNYKGVEKIFVEQDNLYPLYVERKLSMGWDKEEITEIYDIKNKSVTIKKVKNGKTLPDLFIEKPTVIQNSISLLYYCRLINDFSLGKILSINLPTKSYELEIKKVVDIKVPFGTSKAYLLEDKKGAFRIWIGTDENHFPLKFEYSSFMNSYSMRMKAVSTGKDE